MFIALLFPIVTLYYGLLTPIVVLLFIKLNEKRTKGAVICRDTNVNRQVIIVPA
jgi:hypothetical protein